MVAIFLLGILVGIVAPFWRRDGKARCWVLAAGAATLIAIACVGLLNQDPREGTATVAANRRQY
jgi:hypothetical protein